MRHYAAPSFWSCYRRLPPPVRKLADNCFATLKADPKHRSLRLKRIGPYTAVRVGIHWRALAVEAPDGLLWFWIGSHAEYDKIIG